MQGWFINAILLHHFFKISLIKKKVFKKTDLSKAFEFWPEISCQEHLECLWMHHWVHVFTGFFCFTLYCAISFVGPCWSFVLNWLNVPGLSVRERFFVTVWPCKWAVSINDLISFNPLKMLFFFLIVKASNKGKILKIYASLNLDSWIF